MACLFTEAYIKSAIRSILNESLADFWSDDQLENWIKEASVDISAKSLCYEATQAISIAVNTIEYAEPTDCLKVHSCCKATSTTTESWDERFDTDYWTDGIGNESWDSIHNKWNTSGLGFFYVETVGTWAQAYRPDKLRLTHNHIAPIGHIDIFDTNDDDIGEADAYESGDEIDLTFGDYDIGSITFDNDALPNFSVTNIEFGSSTTVTKPNKGLIRVHPRLIAHLPDNDPGEPIFWYHHHNKIGFYPVADAAYTALAFFSKRANVITDLPCHMRDLAILFCLANARFKEGAYGEANFFHSLYLNSLMFNRQTIWHPAYAVDPKPNLD